jgi:Tfp pilus assembly PilM family ATPase/Tfp pilus assembly protein PilN
MDNMMNIKRLSSLASSSFSLFQRIWNPLCGILSLSPADENFYPAKNISVSIERGRLSVAYGSRFLSKITMRKSRQYTYEEGRYPQPDFLASSLTLFLSEFGASGVDVTFLIPKAWTIIQTVDLPVTVRENLPEVLSYELDRLTPFSAENALYDYRVISTDAEKLRVMLVVARADIVKPYLDILSVSGINVSRISVSLSSFQTVLHHVDSKFDNIIFLSVIGKEYEGALFSNGEIKESFAGSFSGEDQQAQVQTITSALSPLMNNVKQHGKSPAVITLLQDMNASLKESLRQSIGFPVSSLHEMDMKITMQEKTDKIPYAAIGCTLESLLPKAHRINLLSKGFNEKSSSPKILTIVLLCIILSIWIVYLLSPLKVESRKLQAIDHQISIRKDAVMNVNELKNELKSLNTDIETIYTFKHDKPSAMNVLKELTTILPKSTWLTRIRISETRVQIEGYAASASGLLSKLETSPYFQKAEFAAPTFRDKRLSASRFNIKVEFEGTDAKKESEPAVGEGERDEE